MTIKTLDQLTSETTPAPTDLIPIQPLAGPPMKSIQWSVLLAAAQAALGSAYLSVTNNLSDLASAATARLNLGLGTAATHAVGDFAQTANNLSDLPSPVTARTNLGGGALGSALFTSANALNARQALGIYDGSVNANGTAGYLPVGWSVTHTGTGDYTITHNIGTTAYVVNATADQNSNAAAVERVIRSANSFEVIIAGFNSGTFFDAAFGFTLDLH
jgi:hypothetical protein